MMVQISDQGRMPLAIGVGTATAMGVAAFAVSREAGASMSRLGWTGAAAGAALAAAAGAFGARVHENRSPDSSRFDQVMAGSFMPLAAVGAASLFTGLANAVSPSVFLSQRLPIFGAAALIAAGVAAAPAGIVMAATRPS